MQQKKSQFNQRKLNKNIYEIPDKITFIMAFHIKAVQYTIN